MKKSIMFSLLMFVTVFTFAQRGEVDQGAKIQKRVDRMTEQLDLSADQQSQVKNLMLTQQKSRNTNGKKHSELSEAEKETMKVERKAAKASYDEKLAAILTNEQLGTYKNLSKRKGRRGASKRKGNKEFKGKDTKEFRGKDKKGKVRKSSAERTQKKVAKLTEQLNLTADQQAQVTELMMSKGSNKKARKSRKGLSTEEREAMKAEHKTASEAYNTKFEQILTAEQLATYQKMKADRKGKGKKGDRRKRSKK